ncbi:hypothetical protein TEA_030110 [Camellia sinensis var. sinensis]|uniref:Bidirectional sugar transporter SWEET n=1 Tax=Camellia sinensis var. sinensis TaxID=542762 RepID=A0A4S4DTS2_CAMSN|nr:hypothetical protein TEA_030110 [Camellia sinensis var. sinensis]
MEGQVGRADGRRFEGGWQPVFYRGRAADHGNSISVVNDTFVDCGFVKDVGTREGQVEQVVVNVRKDNSCSAEEDSILKKLPRIVNDDSRVVSGGLPVLTPGFVKSLSGSEGSRPSINIEVVLEGAQVGGPVDGLSCALINKEVSQTQNGLAQSREHTLCLSQAQELVRFNTTTVGREPVVTVNTHRLQEGKEGGSRGRGRRRVHRNVASFSGSFQRGALLRAAVVALSHSQSQNSRSSRRRKLAIEEAHATLQLGKRLGMNCEGKENEVVQKIVELELQDAERFDKIAKGGQPRRPIPDTYRSILPISILRDRYRYVTRYRDLELWCLSMLLADLFESGMIKGSLPYAVCSQANSGVRSCSSVTLFCVLFFSILFCFLYWFLTNLGSCAICSSLFVDVKAVSLLLLGTGWFGLIFILTNFLTRGQARLHIVGWFCLVFSVCVFAAPLNIMNQVIRTKSVEFMPFYLSLSLTFSAIMWFFYGILRKDLNISIPNVIGFILGVLQMILYAIYKNGKKVEEQGLHVVEERQTEVVEEAVEQCIDVSAKV